MLVFYDIYMKLTGFWCGNLKVRDHHLEDVVAGGMIVLKLFLNKSGERGVDWIYFAQERTFVTR
jgi:hypothetical protein